MSNDVALSAVSATPAAAAAVPKPAHAQETNTPQRHHAAPVANNQVDAYLKAHTQSVRFQVDTQTGMTIVNIYNEATGELVQQIPNEVVVRIAQYLHTQHSDESSGVDAQA